jgi:hypothetical protein
MFRPRGEELNYRATARVSDLEWVSGYFDESTHGSAPGAVEMVLTA